MLWDAQDCEAQLFERSPYYVELLSILLGEVPSKCLTPVAVLLVSAGGYVGLSALETSSLSDLAKQSE